MSFFSPILNRPGVKEGGEKVNINSLSLISIRGFFGFLSILYLIRGFTSFFYPFTPFLLTNPTRRFLGRLG